MSEKTFASAIVFGDEKELAGATTEFMRAATAELERAVNIAFRDFVKSRQRYEDARQELEEAKQLFARLRGEHQDKRDDE